MCVVLNQISQGCKNLSLSISTTSVIKFLVQNWLLEQLTKILTVGYVGNFTLKLPKLF